MKGEFLSTKGDGGTPHWMVRIALPYFCFFKLSLMQLFFLQAPEVLLGVHGISEKSDVYSFGVILFELVTREIPWKELGHAQAITWAVLSKGERLQMPEGVQPEIVSLATDCWNNEPSLRPSFSSIIERLSAMDCIFPPGISSYERVSSASTSSFPRERFSSKQELCPTGSDFPPSSLTSGRGGTQTESAFQSRAGQLHDQLSDIASPETPKTINPFAI